MSLTDEGKDLLMELHFMMREISGIDQLEAELQKRLQIKQVIIVSGDSDEQPWVKNEIGKACVSCITDNLQRGKYYCRYRGFDNGIRCRDDGAVNWKT